MSQQVLWAPWRMEYLLGHKPKGPNDCVFCSLPQEQKDRENLILHRGKKGFIIMNRFPYNSGHLMVVPNRHTPDLLSLNDEESLEMAQLVQHAVRALAETYKTQGYNLGMNLGEAAGAGIKGHIHQHIVPRWIGDTNFMPVIGETKAMPQHLLTTYDQLSPYFRRL